MKKGLIIGAGKDSIHAIQIAKKLGIYVIAMDGNPCADGLEAADEKIVLDISNIDAVETMLQDKEVNFTIPIPIGRCLNTMGEVNERFELPGVKSEAVMCSTDKYRFHVILAKKGLRPVWSCLLGENTNLDRITFSFPAIVKPRFGSGSRDVWWLENEEEKDRLFQRFKQNDLYRKEDYVIEEAVPGQEYGVDGAVIDGEMMITLIRKKVITPLPVRQAIASISMDKDKDFQLYEKVHNYLAEVCHVLGYNNCLINADIIVNGEDVFCIEIAPRPSGHSLHDVFVPLATNIDLVEEYLKCVMKRGGEFSGDRVKKLEIHYFNFEDVIITEIPDYNMLKKNKKCNIIAWECNIEPGEHMGKVTNGHSVMGRGYFVVEGNDENDLAKQCDWILQQFGIKE